MPDDREPWMPRDERLGRMRAVRGELERHLGADGPVSDAIADATATYAEGPLGGRQKVGQQAGRREHHAFWAGIRAAVRALDATIARLEGEAP